MVMTDPVADMLTRIRNALGRNADNVDVPASKLKQGICDKLKEQGYIIDYNFIKNKEQGILRLYLKYGPDGEAVINELERISKPGLRKYVGVDEIPRVKSGLGVALLSTSNGVLTGREAREENVGGEHLCEVW
ncbi:MAG: 30S ribosomal protein S8 [bacterium]